MTTSTRTRLPQNQPLAVRPLTAEVRSETDPDRAYIVTLPQCRAADGQPCPDFFYRRGNPSSPFCKHLKAAMGMSDTSRLDEEAAIDLLTGFAISSRTAGEALRRARVRTMETVGLPGRDALVLILWNKGSESYDVRLP